MTTHSNIAEEQALNDIVSQAAEWLVKLSTEDPKPNAEDHAAFKKWQNSDPRHSKAVKRMEGMVGQLKELSAKPAHAALKKTKQNENESWTSLTKILSVTAFLFLPLWLMMMQTQITGLLADKYTSTGEWQTHTLSDNSHITLNSNSAINLQFNQEQRTVELLHGEILVDVAHDATRPFVVTTKYGELKALGTRFVVQRKDNATVLTVLESRVSAKAAYDSASNSETILTPGQRLTLYDDHVSEIETIDLASYEDAWLSHQLVVQGKPLPDVLEQLSRFHPGHIHYNSNELTHLRVSAVLPLDEPQRALQLLGESFPIHISQFTPWWVSVQSDVEK